MGSYQVLSFRARVDLGAMAIKKILRIPQSMSISRTSPSDYLESYAGDSLEESNPSAEKRSMYSLAPADLAP